MKAPHRRTRRHCHPLPRRFACYARLFANPAAPPASEIFVPGSPPGVLLPLPFSPFERRLVSKDLPPLLPHPSTAASPAPPPAASPFSTIPTASPHGSPTRPRSRHARDGPRPR